jgi:serine/threonine protein kinase
MSSPTDRPTSKPVVLFSSGATSYEFIRYLGTTSNAEVLLARRRYTDAVGGAVIVKRLPQPSNALSHARLLEEFKLFIQLSHPCISQVFLVRMHEGSPYVVMEHVDGFSLEALLNFSAMRGIPLSEQFGAYAVAEVADALHHAHTLKDLEGRPLGIVHRDVSPRNLYLSPRGSIKVTDFAVAYSKLEGRLATVGPLLKGDIAYSSPEYLLLQPLEPRSDLFSLGVVLLELVTGRHLLDLPEVEQAMSMAGEPSTGQALLESEETSWVDAPEMAMRMERFRPEHVERATQKLSAPMRAIIQRALQREPSARYQSGLELRDALWNFLEEHGRCYGAREAAQESTRLRAETGRRSGGAEVPDEEPAGLVVSKPQP